MTDSRFRKLLDEGSIIVFDGAMGTMLFGGGVFINRCFDELNLRGADLVRDIHQRYVQAGAMVLETNTFGANRFKLAAHGLQAEVEAINAAGVRLAREAASDRALVAGSVGPLGVRIEPWGPTSLDEARAAFREQIAVQIAAGVDALALETFTDLAEMQQAIAAAHEAREAAGRDVPIVALMTVGREGNSLFGTEPAYFGRKLEEWGADVVGVNCSVGPKPMLETLEKLAAATARPLAVMPNAGLPSYVEGRAIYMCSPDYLAGYARRFVQLGARIVGGCCGTTPEHIRAVAQAVRQIASEGRSLRTVTAPAVEEITAVTAQPIPIALRSRLGAKLAAGELVASIEISPPQGWNPQHILKNARLAAEAGFDSINIPDGPRASARMGALATAVLIEREVGAETILHYACRDRNLVGMQSDLLGAYALGLRNILIITGDPPLLGDYPNATGVFDVDSIGLTNMVSRLNRGIDLGGRSIGAPTGHLVFVGLNPTALDAGKELDRFRWKVEAGADAAITQPVFDAEQLLGFLDEVRRRGLTVPVLAGIWPLSSLRNAEFLANEVPGVTVPDAILKRMAKAAEQDAERQVGEEIAIEIFEKVRAGVQGIQIAAPFGRVASAARVLEAARGG